MLSGLTVSRSQARCSRSDLSSRLWPLAQVSLVHVASLSVTCAESRLTKKARAS
jgi:hypothetical protein